MSVRVEKIDLPGIGIRHDIVTKLGRHIGVLNYRDGRRELAFYDSEDPDTVLEAVELSTDESDSLADLLGHKALLSQITDLGGGALGLFTEQLQLASDSRYLDQPLSATKARTVTGCSIVAIVRGESVIPSPAAEEPLRAEDTLVVVGTRTGLDKLEHLLAQSDG
jgi:TrkA domain protein